MKDEFEKLDQFMQRNVPLMSKSISAKSVKPSGNRTRVLEYAFALGLSSIIAWGVIDYHNATMRDTVELSDALEWEEITSDGLEDAEFVAFVDEET